jgi:hypothetical protein
MPKAQTAVERRACRKEVCNWGIVHNPKVQQSGFSHSYLSNSQEVDVGGGIVMDANAITFA